MNVTQSIETPFGVNVFGSSIVRVEPDVASLQFAVARLKPHPRDAFRETRQAVQGVRAYLAQAGFDDIGSSRVILTESFRYRDGEHHFEGYVAKVTFHVLLHDLDRIEEILVGVVESGANHVNEVELQTSRLKDLRAETRRRAVAAAREKAEGYCQAAGISLGPVVHIEDVSPTRLRSAPESHVTRETPPDDEGPLRAFDPGSIVVGAAVMVAFKIGVIN